MNFLKFILVFGGFIGAMTPTKIFCQTRSLEETLANTPMPTRPLVIQRYIQDTSFLSDSILFFRAIKASKNLAQQQRDVETSAWLWIAEAAYFARKNEDNLLQECFNKALQLADIYNLKMVEGEAYFLRGNHYLRQENWKEALGHFIRCHLAFDEVGWDKVSDAPKKFCAIAEVLLTLELVKESVYYLEKGERYLAECSDKATYYQYMGWSYRGDQNNKRALDCFQKCLQAAIECDDKKMIGVCNGEIGYNFFIEGNIKQAENHLLIDYQTSLALGELASASNALSILAIIDARNNRKENALQKIKESERLCNEASKESRAKYSCNEITLEHIVEAYKLLNDEVSAQNAAYRLHAIMDSTNRVLQDSIHPKETTEEVTAAVYERRLGQMHREKYLLRWIYGLVSLCLILIIIFIYYILSRERRGHARAKVEYARSEARLRSEKVLVEQELAEAREKLEKFAQNARHRHENDSEADAQTETGEAHETLSGLFILTENDWQEFKTLFSKVFPNFIETFKERYPALTPGDFRLLALTHLDIPSKNMASMLGVSAETVRKARQRLRKKIDISEQDDLKDWILRQLNTEKF